MTTSPSTCRTSCITASLETFRSALALNNVGVSLLQDGRFAKALETLHESLQMLHHAFADPAPKATKNEAKRQVPTNAVQQRSVVEVSPVDENDFESLNSASKYGSSSNVVFPIRIRDCPTLQDDNDGQQVARHVAIMVYNQGIAQFLLSMSSSEKGETRSRGSSSCLKSVDRKQHLSRAAKAYRFVETTSSSVMHHQNSKNEDDATATATTNGGEQEMMFAWLSALSLACLAQIRLEQNKITEAHQIQQKAHRLQNQAEDQYSSSFCSLTAQKQTAPAA